MKLAERYRGILGWFEQHMPVVGTELNYRNPYQLLVATMLAAQCTDKRVNLVSGPLFERFPDPEALAGAEIPEIYAYIKSVTYPNSKARHLKGMAEKLTTDFGGQVPDDPDRLRTLPGVGRKTANVVGAVAFGRPVMPVDTHVFRVAARLGLSRGAKTPLQTERQLSAHIPAELLPTAHHWLILHGRYVCLARKPRCEACGLVPWCRFFQLRIRN
jgi:endonuclease-3